MNLQGLPEPIAQSLAVWLNIQLLQPTVIRWGAFVKHQGTRPQNNLQHTLSVTDFACTVAEALLPYNTPKFDKHLIAVAFSVHDYPEGVLQQDTLYNLKTDNQDLKEYLAFLAHYETHRHFSFWHEAYLLQYCTKERPDFPEPAQHIMRQLQQECSAEIKAFDAIQRLDYLLYAIEQRLELDNRDILAHVVQNQAPHLDRLTAELPGLRETYWTAEVRHWCLTMAAGGNPAVPTGPK